MKNFLVTLSCMLFAVLSFGQDESEPASKVMIENADNQITEIVDDNYVQYLRRNVRVIHDSIFMFCDSARLTENQLTALSNVVILQGDSIKSFADSLYYDGDSKLAKLYFDVVLQNDQKKIFTEYLIYDLDARIATFPDTCLLVNDDFKLSSLRANYNVGNELAFFYGEVTAIDPQFKLKTDSLMYDTELDRVYFIAPSFIEQDGRKIYCEDGFYDIQEKRAYFGQNPVYFDDSITARSKYMVYSGIDSTTLLTGDAIVQDSSSTASADLITIDEKSDDVTLEGNARYVEGERVIEGPKIIYNKASGDVKLEGRSTIFKEDGFIQGDTMQYYEEIDEGTIIGNPYWKDTIENRSLEGGKFFYKEKQKYFRAVVAEERPVFKELIDGDTLYFSSDTIVSAEDADSLSYLEATRFVRIFKSDLQAVCDSLYYSERDSSFQLFGQPVVWSDTTQFTGDTIIIQLRNGAVSEIISKSRAYIITRDFADLFNQIRGKYIHAFLDSNKLQRMDVKGNAESIYFVKDEEDAYIGPIRTSCSQMRFYFVNDSLDHVRYYTENNSELVPMRLAGEPDKRLEGFKWHEESRPVKWQDILAVDRRRSPEPVPGEPTAGDEFEKAVMETFNKGEKKTNKNQNKRGRK